MSTAGGRFESALASPNSSGDADGADEDVARFGVAGEDEDLRQLDEPDDERPDRDRGQRLAPAMASLARQHRCRPDRHPQHDRGRDVPREPGARRPKRERGQHDPALAHLLRQLAQIDRDVERHELGEREAEHVDSEQCLQQGRIDRDAAPRSRSHAVTVRPADEPEAGTDRAAD